MVNGITVIAHRSGPVNFPEQTVAAATESVILGADLVEIDLRFSRDKNIVISHDKNTQRVFGKNYNISEISGTFYYNLYRSGEDSAFRGHLLADFIKDRSLPLLLHVKEGGKENIERIVKLLNEFRGQPRIVFGVSSVEDIDTLKTLFPEGEILAFMPKPEDLDAFLASGADYIRLWQDWTSKENTEKIHNAGKKVWIMTGTPDENSVGKCEEGELASIMAMDIDGILINDVRQVIK